MGQNQGRLEDLRRYLWGRGGGPTRIGTPLVKEKWIWIKEWYRNIKDTPPPPTGKIHYCKDEGGASKAILEISPL